MQQTNYFTPVGENISMLENELQWPLLLTWFNFNPSMDEISNYIHYKVWDEITYPFLNFNVQPLKFRNG